MTDPRAYLLAYEPHIQQSVLSSIHFVKPAPVTTLNADHDGDTPSPMVKFFAGGITALLEKHLTKLATEKMIWFTLRTEPNGDVYLNWPISAYMSVSAGRIYYDQKVQRACTRLKGRAHIREIKVTGAVKPSVIPLYFEWVGTE